MVVTEDILIKALVDRAQQIIKEHKILEPHQFREKLGLGSDKDSLKNFRETMSQLIHAKTVKWNPCVMAWELVIIQDDNQ